MNSILLSASRPAAPACQTCHLPPFGPLKQRRCNACDCYWRKHSKERPSHLWGRDFTGRLAERLAAAGQ
jgi:hypothetical protein